MNVAERHTAKHFTLFTHQNRIKYILSVLNYFTLIHNAIFQRSISNLYTYLIFFINPTRHLFTRTLK